MNKKETIKKRLLLLLLSLALLIGVIPTTVLAAEAEELWVNGVNILTANNKTVSCGSGNAVYNETTSTLTLTNAIIKIGRNGIGINKNGAVGSSNQLNIILVGNNAIETTSENPIHAGIYSMGKVYIGGDTLSITTSTHSMSYTPYGIYAWAGCVIENSHTKLVDTSTVNMVSSGIDVNQFTSAFYAKNSTIVIDGYNTGVNVPSGDITVDSSHLTVTNANRGISGGNEIDNFKIIDSTFNCTVSGERSLGLLNGHDIWVDNSTMKIDSEKSNAICTDGKLSIKNNSSLDAKGYFPALYSMLDMSITDSKVIAASTNDSAIFSRGNITVNGTSDIIAKGYWSALNSAGNLTINNGKVDITSSNDMAIWARGTIFLNGGDIYAKGADGMAAIGVRYDKQESDTDPTAKILINNNLSEVNGAKVSVSDWFNVTNNGNSVTRSWTSFISKDEANKLALDRSNALNEVTIKIKLADYSKVDEAIAKIPADLSKYTDLSVKALNDAKNAVVRNKNITEQNTVNGYAIAIENTIKALVVKSTNPTTPPAQTPTTPPATEQPKIIEGANQSVIQGTVATFKSNADIRDFVRVLIDGKEISPEHYIVKEGSTIINLKDTYVKTLCVGSYTLSIVSTTGTADAPFTITKSDTPPTLPTPLIKNPQTGDSIPLTLPIMSILGLILLAFGLLLKRKGNQ